MSDKLPALCLNQLMQSNNIEKIINGTYQESCIHLFGITHFKYLDCVKEDLIKVPIYLKTSEAKSDTRVHKECLEAFLAMSQAAKKEGITLLIESGYRSSTYQIEVFKRKLDHTISPSAESLKKRLQVSAPAGFSEHHTGYAIDINSTEDSFAHTKEFTWLQNNAPDFGFKMSFPPNNTQGINFEPWHWKFVNSENAKKIFYER